MTDPKDIVGILICKDLFFTGSVTATARAHGFPMKVCLSLAQAEAALAQCPAVKVVIVDMNLLDPENANDWQQLRSVVTPPIVLAGFGSHVDTRRFAVAQAAGFDHAMPNSAFSGRMVEWLKNWMG
jgi:hypothetical protein